MLHMEAANDVVRHISLSCPTSDPPYPSPTNGTSCRAGLRSNDAQACAPPPLRPLHTALIRPAPESRRRPGPTALSHDRFVRRCRSHGVGGCAGVEEKPSVHPETVREWHDWLAAHHGRGAGVWLVQWKRHTGRPAMTYEEAVTEALAWGWVDSTAGTVDADRARLWYAPRRPASGWSRPNKRRVELLLAEGRMQPAGQRCIDVAKEHGAWSLLDDVENLVVPDDLAAALDARAGARAHWDAFPRSPRRAMLEWLVQAKKPETRQRRITEIADEAERGERAR